MNKRHLVSELFAIGIRRFIEAKPEGVECSVAVTISNLELPSKCEFFYSYSENEPLSNKWNNGISFINRPFFNAGFNWDYVCIIGDDDIFDSKAWSAIMPMIEAKEDFFGFCSIYFYEPRRELLSSYKYNFDKLIGCGTFISRKAVENCMPLWEEGLNAGLDGSRDMKLQLKGYTPKFIEGLYMVDVKTRDNIWGWHAYEAGINGRYNEPRKTLNFLSEKEWNQISKIKEHDIRNTAALP